MYEDTDIIAFLQTKGRTMSQSIWLTIGLVLIVEGLGPLIAPNGWRNMVAQLSQQPDAQLRRIGGCLVVAGAVIAFMTYNSVQVSISRTLLSAFPRAPNRRSENNRKQKGSHYGSLLSSNVFCLLS